MKFFSDDPGTKSQDWARRAEHVEAAIRKTEFKKSLASLSAPYQTGSNWYRLRDDSISFPRARSRRGTKGPRPLVAMCLRVLADNIGACSPDMISPLPRELRWALWKELLPRQVRVLPLDQIQTHSIASSPSRFKFLTPCGFRTMSLHAWKILSSGLIGASFVRAYKTREEGHNNQVTVPMAMYRYCQEIVNPPCPLAQYTLPLSGMNHLAYLCIDNVAHFESHEFVRLAYMSQLVVLELIERDPIGTRISDRLIKGWTELAENFVVKISPFPALRVLKITSRTHAVSEASLRHVLEFPALQIFDITAFPAQRWRMARDIAAGYGWKATKPEGSVFVSYANAYLDGLIVVPPSGVDGLRTAFEDDRLQLPIVGDPQRDMVEVYYQDLEDDRAEWGDEEGEEGEMGEEGEEGEESENKGPDFSAYLDDGWRALLQGNHPLSKTDHTQAASNTQRQPEMSDNDVFWLLSLLDLHEYDAEKAGIGIRTHLAGITLPWSRLVSLRLRTPCNASEQSRRLLNSQRLIFSRCRREAEATVSDDGAPELSRAQAPRPGDREEATVPEARALEPSWAPRADDRRETDLRPRKRQKVGHMFASFGM